MNGQGIVTVTISSLALIISIYGIYERRVAAYKALRIRLTELLDSLATINAAIETAYAGKSPSEAQQILQYQAERQALLAAQSLDLVNQYRGHITTPEYVNLAKALRSIGHTTAELTIWKQAVQFASKHDTFYLAAAWKGLGWYLFEQRDVGPAREALRHFLDAKEPIHDTERYDRITTLLSWCDFELGLIPVDVEMVKNLLHEAINESERLTNQEWRETFTEHFGNIEDHVRVLTSRDQGKESHD